MDIPERSNGEWDGAGFGYRLVQLGDGTTTYVTLEEFSELPPETISAWVEQEMRSRAYYRASRPRNDLNVAQEGTNVPNRPVDRRFGSDGNQYNPYAPHTSNEYMMQEIAAGRMNPEMMDIPRHPANPPRSPVSGNASDQALAHAHAGSDASWMTSGYRTAPRHDANLDPSDRRNVSWFRHPYDGSTAAEELSEEEYPNVHPGTLTHLDFGGSPASSQTTDGIAPDPVFASQANSLSSLNVHQRSLSLLNQPRWNEVLALGLPQQSHPLSTRRERRRRGKPSLVVKLKAACGQKNPQNAVSLTRGRSDASSSSESSSTAQTNQVSPLNLGPRESVVVSPTDAGSRSGWDSLAVRRLTRRAEAIQSSHRKRRRHAQFTPDVSTQGTGRPITGPPQTPSIYGRRASTGTSEPHHRSTLRADAPVFVPGLPPMGGSTSENTTALDAIRITLARHLDRQANHVPSRPRPSTYLPPFRYFRTRRLIFTSELLPRSFCAEKRRAILNLFRSKAPYIPACINISPGMPSMQYHVVDAKPPVDIVPYHAPLGPNGLGWPKDSLPLEVFQNMASHLSCDDLLQMRMVNSDFERKISNIVFHTVVVPFRPEIYGMMIHDDPTLEPRIDIKGKGKAKEIYGPVEQEKTVHDGMKVFQAWGPHIKKFAMAFDVEEDQLVKPPVKGKFESFSEFWGKYRWPHPYYSRFDFCAGLENKADEFRCMSAALSNLLEVRELGVSIDSGLGYLCGPDISDHAQLFQEKPKIFGVSRKQMGSKFLERQCKWNGIVRSLGPASATNYVIQGDTILANQTPLMPNEHGYYEVHLHYPLDPRSQSWVAGVSRNKNPRVPSIDAIRRRPSDRPLIFQGIDLANSADTGGMTGGFANGDVDTHDHASVHGREKSPFHAADLVPNNLTPAQKEWLLETEWAQRAFLSSYCMALADNSHTFQHVRSFTVARLSSRYLSALQREDFWRALPNLNALTINVSADWRNILKLDSGVVEAPDIRPSGAATQFHKLLATCIAVLPGIKTLNLGYIGGGEQQVGIFGRNRHILPAPLTDFSDHHVATSVGADILALPHVEHLSLTNCWITPPALKTFVAQTRAAKLRTLTLDSVSLTAHSGVRDNMEPNPLGHGVLLFPDGPPRRFGDPAVGNLFQQRGRTPDPRSDGTGWMVESRRIGSWGNVIDAITPGPTVGLLRYAYQHIHNAPKIRDPSPLERINFVSCGYVKLVNMKDFNQAILGEVSDNPPKCLRRRALDLLPVMMNRSDDPLLGQIIPTLHDHELEVLQTAFPMELSRNRMTDWDNHEDGQPNGGSGRFSGHVEKLIFPAET